MPSNNPSSVLAASPSSDTSNGMVSSWPSTNTRPTMPQTVTQAGDRAQQRRAITPVDNGEPVS